MRKAFSRPLTSIATWEGAGASRGQVGYRRGRDRPTERCGRPAARDGDARVRATARHMGLQPELLPRRLDLHPLPARLQRRRLPYADERAPRRRPGRHLEAAAVRLRARLRRAFPDRLHGAPPARRLVSLRLDQTPTGGLAGADRDPAGALPRRRLRRPLLVRLDQLPRLADLWDGHARRARPPRRARRPPCLRLAGRLDALLQSLVRVRCRCDCRHRPPPRMDRGWRRAYIVLVPLCLYALWWLGWGHEAESAVSLHNIATTPLFVLNSFAAAVSALAGLAIPADGLPQPARSRLGPAPRRRPRRRCRLAALQDRAGTTLAVGRACDRARLLDTRRLRGQAGAGPVGKPLPVARGDDDAAGRSRSCSAARV